MAKISNQATWIWYPGDYEIWLGNRMNNRRTERGAFFPPFWKSDSHFVTVEFSTVVDLAAAEEIEIESEGIFNLKLDGKLQFGMPKRFLLPAGRHNLNIKVWNQATPPAIYVEGATIASNSRWRVTFEDKEWIDESGKASDTSATIYASAGSWNFTKEQRPSAYALCREPLEAASVAEVEGGLLYDFGRETFGYAVLEGVAGVGELAIYYGESPEEAQDTEYCETLDRLAVTEEAIVDLAVNASTPKTERYVLGNSKAFRYLYVTTEGVTLRGVSMEYEYAPVDYRGSFRSSDEELNRIWEIGAYTMHLTTREFFIDGIKRDRWVWSGDAVQSYLMNYYLFFDSECVKRTTWLLRGKDPVTAHTNTIMDYTFYWFIGIYDYYMYTGDLAFVKQIYPRMQTMMEYVLGRTNRNGMVEGMTGDWVFVDWADGFLDKKGELAIEQVLLCKSLETMALCASLAEVEEDVATYEQLAAELRAKLMPAFWSEAKQAMVHNRIDGVQSESVTRYANMFATFFGYLTPAQQEQIKHSVLLNDEVLKITTPYMRFYELEALCVMGEQEAVMGEMKAYWGGMLREGATSFWEKYNPSEQGVEHLAMYGRPYGKSLCHAWGASPIYLLGKYYLGVRPVKPGYAEFEIRPTTGGLEWMEGVIPTPNGAITVKIDQKTIHVEATEGEGWLYFRSEGAPKASEGEIESLGEGEYRLWVATAQPVTVNF
ncbi:MAG: alpha-rhamnosidase [Alistipes sp.]|nr:alpha-rhamnosidase [Alistipes sp.]